MRRATMTVWEEVLAENASDAELQRLEEEPEDEEITREIPLGTLVLLVEACALKLRATSRAPAPDA